MLNLFKLRNLWCREDTGLSNFHVNIIIKYLNTLTILFIIIMLLYCFINITIDVAISIILLLF